MIGPQKNKILSSTTTAVCDDGPTGGTAQRVGLLLGICLLSCALSSPAAFSQDDAWETQKSDHFILYCKGPDRTFPDRVLRAAESHYGEMARTLGFSRRSEFWLWEKRGRIYLYETKEAFHTQTKQDAWSGGFAVPSERKIVSYQGSETFIESVLPHELAHLIFHDFLGTENGEIPLWVDEGLAMAQERAKRASFDALVKTIIGEKKWIPVQTISKIHSAKGMPTAQAAVFYAQAQSMVRFLLTLNPSRFTGFCRNLRDGMDLETALRKNYPKDIPDMRMLEEKWAMYGVNS